MTIPAISFPKHWEDWANLLIGVWLCASTWLLPLSDDALISSQNAWLIGLLLILTESVTLSAFRPWEEWVSVVIGAWLVVSPWVLGITALAPMANFVVVGFVVLALALYQLWDLRRHSVHAA
jgi:hypothetical protein